MTSLSWHLFPCIYRRVELITSVTSQVTFKADVTNNLLYSSFQELLPITAFVFSSLSSIIIHLQCKCYMLSVSNLACAALKMSLLIQSACLCRICCFYCRKTSSCNEVNLVKDLHCPTNFLN